MRIGETKKLALIFSLILLIGVLATGIVISVDGVFISTDKSDYAPEESVLISGGGFNAAGESNPVSIQVTRPDGSVNVCPDPVWCPASLPTSSSFTDYLYHLDGIEGTYTIDASDSVNNAQVSFSDCVSSCCGNIDCECTSKEFDFGIEKFECSETSPEVDDPSYNIGVTWGSSCDSVSWTSNPAVAGVLSKEDNLALVVHSGGTSGSFSKSDCYSISHITFCGNNPPVCGDGKVEGDEECEDDGGCSLGETCEACECVPVQPYCGDGQVSGSEECELPSTNDNSYCTQSTSECSGVKLGTRDSKGNCNSDCGCVLDSFTYQCVKDQCGATCAVGADCQSGVCDTDTCTCILSCTPTTEVCNNQVDDDCDSLVDCADPDCSQNPACVCANDLTGPVTSNLVATKLPGQCKMNIEATETDACSDVVAAEYFIEGSGCPDKNTRGTPMDVKDGGWDELIEDVVANNIVIWDGSFNIYVRGKDENGNWGACKAVRLDSDCIPPNYPTCGVLGDLLGVNGLCGVQEELVCDNDPTITANICDDESRIQMAEYFIDQNCSNPNLCLNWQGINMTASDGSYDERCEDVYAVVNLDPLDDGTHYVQLHGKDGQENWGKFILNPIASFIKDTTPPVSTKEVGEGKVSCNYYGDEQEADLCYYITQETPIEISCQDVDPGDGEFAGGEKLYYRQRMKEDFETQWGVWGEWVIDSDGDATIYKTEDSIHELEYYCVDACGNAEEPHYEIDIVDTQAPETDKNVLGKDVVPGNGNPIDYYLGEDGYIKLTCEDQEPHPVGGEKLYWEVYWNEDCSNWDDEPSYFGIDEDDAVAEIRFKEDSCHKLVYYCEDALGNEEEEHVEIDARDTKPPVITKTIDGPYYGNCPPQDGVQSLTVAFPCFIDGVTEIDVEASDPQPHPVNDVICDWSYTVDGGNPIIGGTGVSVPFTIHFQEESSHLLTITCKDALGNSVTDPEIFLVDKTPSVTTKRYGTPIFYSSSEYLPFSTSIGGQPINVDVEDLGNQVKWTIDFPTDDDSCNGLMAVGLVIATDGEGNGPAFQIHNNDGTDSSYDWGTWLYSPWGPTITDGWHGWHSNDDNTPVSSLGWVQATGARYHNDNPNGIFTITIDKSKLGGDFYWALYTAIGSGFCSHSYQQAYLPSSFSWDSPLVGDTNYEHAESVGTGPHWITSDTEITLTADDGDSVHASGVAEIFYRVSLVNDEYCLNSELCEEGIETDKEYDAASPLLFSDGEASFTFKIPEESCHLIEYYSVDNVDKTENPPKRQCVFVDNTPPKADKEIGEPKIPCTTQGKCGGPSPWPAAYVNGSTPITLSCVDPEPHPVDHEQLCYKISFDEDTDRDGVPDDDGISYLTENYCKMFGGNYVEGYCCVQLDEEDNGDWGCDGEGSYKFHFLEDSLHNIKWYCEDALGNEGAEQLEWDSADLTPPEITIWNPTLEEARNVERCAQSVVVQISDLKSGVNVSTVYAELYYANGTAVPNHKVALVKSIYGTYEGLMDKQLPAGNYVLKVFATDNVGNQQIAERPEYLAETVFVEYISPAFCTVNPLTGGSCDFTFHVCMRGNNRIQFWMDKLGEIITPGMMGATISHNGNSTFVGLKHDEFESDAGVLLLGEDCVEINGKETFDLHLNLNINVTSQIGPGVHDLEYWIESSMPGECEPGVSFEELGQGDADWTTLEKHSGSSSVELSVVDGTQDWAGVDIPVDIPLNEINSLSFWELIDQYNPNGFSVNVILGVDADDDGTFETDLPKWHGVGGTMHQTSDLHGDTFVEMDGAHGLNPTLDTWMSTNAYSTAQWWTPNAAGNGFNMVDGDCYNTLTTLMSGCEDRIFDPTDHVKLIKLEIGGSSSWKNEVAYIDSVALNGNVIIDEPTV